MNLLSLKNPYYEFYQLDDNININSLDERIYTFFVVSGKISFKISDQFVQVNENEGLLVSQNTKIQEIKKDRNSFVFMVRSKKKTNQLFEFVDQNNEIKEVLVNGFKILKDHKKVTKPWGYELWIVWLKDYHVLKKIHMKKGFKCSLQFHEKKYETNFLISGKAKVIKDKHINPNSSEEDAKKELKNVNLLADYSKDYNALSAFTNIPGEIHRVYSLEDYTAYEVSTPELDDVIRIVDDNNRISGRIKTEHK
jgi:mannose-6-phosphate isomerase